MRPLQTQDLARRPSRRPTSGPRRRSRASRAAPARRTACRGEELGIHGQLADARAMSCALLPKSRTITGRRSSRRRRRRYDPNGCVEAVSRYASTSRHPGQDAVAGVAASPWTFCRAFVVASMTPRFRQWLPSARRPDWAMYRPRCHHRDAQPTRPCWHRSGSSEAGHHRAWMTHRPHRDDHEGSVHARALLAAAGFEIVAVAVDGRSARGERTVRSIGRPPGRPCRTSTGSPCP